MKKLKLNLDDLKVESFNTSNNNAQKGTVLANGSDGTCVGWGLTYECCNPVYTFNGDCSEICNVSEGCQYPTVFPNLTCDNSPGCGPSEQTCDGGGAPSCYPSCMSCAGGVC